MDRSRRLSKLAKSSIFNHARDTVQKCRLLVRSLGLLSPHACDGSQLQSEDARSIYRKLISNGFFPTRWQYVYEGQLAGIVLPFKDGRNEIHLRFYEDGVFAELEVGRAFLSHFFGARFNAEQLVLNFSERVLNKREMRALRCAFISRNLRTDEATLKSWEEGDDPFEETRKAISASRSFFGFILTCTEWRRLFFGTMPLGMLMVALTPLWEIGAALLLGGAVSALMAPAVSRP